jgi:hypothetical protein
MADNGAAAPDQGFGRYLASVAERDIDLLLMEEFHISDDFVAWFCGRVGLEDARPAGAWHSLSDTDGESDLLLRVVLGGKRVGILIENKIAAPEQDIQAERYHLRGIRSREQGKIDDYLTVMCAPERYLEGLSETSVYQHRIAYEQIADWYAGQPGRRAEWRHHIMREAIEQGRRGYTMAVDLVNTAFHFAYWEHLQKRHPKLQMARPKNRGPNSNWIIFKGRDFPKDVKLHHKFDQEVMELGFSGHQVEEIWATKSDWPDDIIPVQKRGTAALSVRVPPIKMSLGIEAQLSAIEDALAVAYRLIPFANLLKSRPVSVPGLKQEEPK